MLTKTMEITLLCDSSGEVLYKNMHIWYRKHILNVLYEET